MSILKMRWQSVFLEDEVFRCSEFGRWRWWLLKPTILKFRQGPTSEDHLSGYGAKDLMALNEVLKKSSGDWADTMTHDTLSSAWWITSTRKIVQKTANGCHLHSSIDCTKQRLATWGDWWSRMSPNHFDFKNLFSQSIYTINVDRGFNIQSMNQFTHKVIWVRAVRFFCHYNWKHNRSQTSLPLRKYFTWKIERLPQRNIAEMMRAPSRYNFWRTRRCVYCHPRWIWSRLPLK